MALSFKSNLKTAYSLIDLTPLVDIIFLLLIFFIVTSDILPLKSLNIQNPTLKEDALPLTTQLLIVVDAQNVIYVGSKKVISDLVSIKEMTTQELEKIKRFHPNSHPTIVLSIDRRVDYGTFLKLFSEIQSLNHPIRLVYQHEET